MDKTESLDLNNDIYYQKYLKYKTKYLELKKQIGGRPCTKEKCPKSASKEHKFNSNRVCKYCGCNL